MAKIRDYLKSGWLRKIHDFVLTDLLQNGKGYNVTIFFNFA